MKPLARSEARPLREAVTEAARAIADDERFLKDCRAAIKTYRLWAEFDATRPTMAQTRRALREFRTHVSALADWLVRSSPVDQSRSPEQYARMSVNAAFGAGTARMFEQLQGLLWDVNTGAARALDSLNRNPQTAPRIAADALRAAFAARSLPEPTGRKAVVLLQAIVAAAGARELTSDAAKKYLKAAGTRIAKITAA